MMFETNNARNFTNDYSGPYRATHMWNSIVESLRNGLPVGRHWRQLKKFDNSFVASDAVTWIHHHLVRNPCYGLSVTRSQAVMLLEKFHKAKVFEDVNGEKYDKQEFTDCSRLYRFRHLSPEGQESDSLSMYGALLGSSNPSCQHPAGTGRRLERRASWKGSFRSLFNSEKENDSKTTNYSAKARRVLQPVNSTIPVTAEALKQTKLSKSDTNIGGHPTIFTDQLKNSQEIYHGSNREQEYHISKKAMTHQSNVNRMYKPKNVDSVKKNSVGTKDPHEIYRQVFCHRLCELLQISNEDDILDGFKMNISNLMHNMTCLNKNGMPSNTDKKDQLPPWVVSAMKCLAYWPQKVVENIPDYPGFERDIFQVVCDYFSELNEPVMTYELYPILLRAVRLLRPLEHSNDEKACMETSFGLDNCTPRTRVIPTRSKSLVGNRPVSCFAQPRIQNSKYCNPVSLVASGTFKTNPGPDEDTLTENYFSKSMPDVTVINRVAAVPENALQSNFQNKMNSDNSSWFDFQHFGSRDTSSEGICPSYTRSHKSTIEPIFDECLTHQQMSEKFLSASSSTHHKIYKDKYRLEVLDDEEDQDYSPKKNFSYFPPPSYNYTSCRDVNKVDAALYQEKNRAELYESSPCIPNRSPFGVFTRGKLTASYRRAVDGRFTYSTPVGKSIFPNSTSHEIQGSSKALEHKLLEVIRMILLLLPPPNRRMLALMVRFLGKMSANPDLSLKENASTRHQILFHFTKHVLSSNDRTILDDELASFIVGFIIDHHFEIFKVPTLLQVNISAAVCQPNESTKQSVGVTRKLKIPASTDKENILTSKKDLQIFKQSKTKTEKPTTPKKPTSILKNPLQRLKSVRF